MRGTEHCISLLFTGGLGGTCKAYVFYAAGDRDGVTCKITYLTEWGTRYRCRSGHSAGSLVAACNGFLALFWGGTCTVCGRNTSSAGTRRQVTHTENTISRQGVSSYAVADYTCHDTCTRVSVPASFSRLAVCKCYCHTCCDFYRDTPRTADCNRFIDSGA